MTCREKLKLEHPTSVDPVCTGGCDGCPSDYGYLESPEWCKHSEEVCQKCWDREIPVSTVSEVAEILSNCKYATIKIEVRGGEIVDLSVNDRTRVVETLKGLSDEHKSMLYATIGEFFESNPGFSINEKNTEKEF